MDRTLLTDPLEGIVKLADEHGGVLPVTRLALPYGRSGVDLLSIFKRVSLYATLRSLDKLGLGLEVTEDVEP